MINPLNHHYAMENPASAYDEEALTALELAGRTTAKVNETVNAFNDLETETNNHLENQDKTIETRLVAQDMAIKKMNDVTMPAKVVSEFQNNLDNGTFEGMVDTYAGNLEARVDNLLGAVSEGGTTGDAELIDIRTGADNHIHNNAGEAVRTQVENLKGEIDSHPTLYRKNLVTTLNYGKYYSTSGNFNSLSDGVYSNPIYLNKGETVYFGRKDQYGNNEKLFLVTKEGNYIAHFNLDSINEDENYAVATAPQDGYYAFNLPSYTTKYHVTQAVCRNLEDLIDERNGVLLPEVLNPDIILKWADKEIKRPNLVTGNLPFHYSGSVLQSDPGYYHTKPIYLRFGETVYTTNVTIHFGTNAKLHMYGDDMETVVYTQQPTEITDNYHKYEIVRNGWYTFNNVGGHFCVCKSLDELEAPMGAYLPEDIIYPDTSIFGNPLTGKTIVFDGDSISHGTSVGSGDPTYGYGWGGRIGEKNGMYWSNESKSGGVIVTGLSGRHSICGNIDNIIATYTDLDYLIIEGGTNDADILGEDKLGTYTVSNYTGTYDTTTFCGALETLFYKAVTQMSNTKIGYIVAPKMGMSQGYTADKSTRRKFFETAITLCKKWGVPYIDLWDGSVLNPRLTAHYDQSLDSTGNIEAGSLYTDGQHLTASGYDRITPQIEAWIKTL